MVQRRVSHETRRLINLDQPRLAFFVDENVDTEYLETQLVLQVLRLRRFLNVGYLVVTRNYGFNSQFFELLPALLPRYHFRVFLPLEVNLFKDRREATLVAGVVRSVVLNKVLTLLVDSIVSKVHE